MFAKTSISAHARRILSCRSRALSRGTHAHYKKIGVATRALPRPPHLLRRYNDENLAMLNFLYGEKKVKRVGILYQADSYGIPARDGIREAMAHLGVGLSREQSYDKIADDVARHDFERDARLWFESGTQAIIFYGIGDWILSTIKYAKRYYGERGRPIYHVVCSFMGMALNNGLKAAGTDPADVFMTQVPRRG